MNIKPFFLATSMVAAICCAACPVVAVGAEVDNPQTAEALEVITVNGDFNRQNLQQTPTSVAVIDASMIQQRNAQHLEDILNTAANINFASGASRARFFQIRGIGERSQFVDSVNPSVGLSIDGIDYSGIGTIATLFDIEQVEIFRGPQGTRFGADAMAGMINLQGHPADGEQSTKVQLSYGNYNTSQLAVAHGGTISEGLYYRAALQKQASDGFIKNRFLHRDDSNNTDEAAARLNLRWLAGEDWQVDLSGHYFDLDNGYDAFSLDNNRETLSDQPGFDRQKTRAVALTGHYSGFVSADMRLNVSYSHSDLAYGYDEDWTHVDFHPWEYSSFDHYFRDQRNQTIDLRFSAKPGTASRWIFGVYRRAKDTALERQSVFGFAPLFNSRFDSHNLAIYGQREWQLDDRVTLTTGLRVEEQTADYDDSITTTEDIDDVMWGGKLNLSVQINDRTLLYTSFSRGYKAGGVNGEAIAKALIDGQDTTADFLLKRKSFDPEVLHSLELGIKGHSDDGSLMLRFSAFYSDRQNVQLKGSIEEPIDGSNGSNGDAPVFVGYIENAAGGKNAGIEAEITYRFSDALQLLTSLGWLTTQVDHFIAQDGSDMDGRDQAHAPQYQYHIGLQYDINRHWFVHFNAEGKDDFYFSMSHNAQSDPVNLLNLSLGYQNQDWELTLWGRNILDRDYAVRGFRFGNDPRDGYATNTYTQLGEPARFGATMRYHF